MWLCKYIIQFNCNVSCFNKVSVIQASTQTSSSAEYSSGPRTHRPRHPGRDSPRLCRAGSPHCPHTPYICPASSYTSDRPGSPSHPTTNRVVSHNQVPRLSSQCRESRGPRWWGLPWNLQGTQRSTNRARQLWRVFWSSLWWVGSNYLWDMTSTLIRRVDIVRNTAW